MSPCSGPCAARPSSSRPIARAVRELRACELVNDATSTLAQ
jgi:hypothetical protein